MDNAATLVTEAHEKLLTVQELMDLHGTEPLTNEQVYDLTRHLVLVEELANSLSVRLENSTEPPPLS